jgi:hypothetical protein
MKPANLAQLINEQDREDKPRPAHRPHSKPLLDAWPVGYENCTFRLDGDDALISAPAKPTIRIRSS